MFLLGGLGFAWLAWYSFRRWGRLGLFLCWIASTLSATALVVARIHQQQVVMGFTAAQQQIPLAPWFLSLWAVALGAIALVIQSGKFADTPVFNARLARATTAALLAGALVYFVVLAWLDIVKLFRWP
jgi:hypothetical protein